MLNSTDYRELRNRERYQTSFERTMSDHGSTEKTQLEFHRKMSKERFLRFKRWLKKP